MDKINNTSDILVASLRSFGEQFSTALPSIIGAFLIFILGWIIAKMITSILKRLLKALNFEKLANKLKVDNLLSKANIQSSSIDLITNFIYWLLMLLVTITAADALGWTAISKEISKLIGYMPQLLSAIIFFIIGTYIATFVRDVIYGATASLGISVGKIIGSIVFYMLLILVTLTALEQGGVETSIITANLLIIVGSVMLAGAVSYGFASRDVMRNILGSYFSKRTYSIGQHIDIDGHRGQIVSISNIAIIIALSEDESMVIPASQFMTKSIKLIKG